MLKILKRLLRATYWIVATIVLFTVGAFFSSEFFEGGIHGKLGMAVVVTAFFLGDIYLFSSRRRIDRSNRTSKAVEPIGKLSDWYHKQTKGLIWLGVINLFITVYFCAFRGLPWFFISTPIFLIFVAFCMHYYLSRAAAMYLIYDYATNCLVGCMFIFSSEAGANAQSAEVQILRLAAIYGLLGILVCMKPTQELFRFHSARGTQLDYRNIAIVGFITLTYYIIVVLPLAVTISIVFKNAPDTRNEALGYFLSITLVFLTILACLRKLPGTGRFPVTFIHNKN